MNRLPVLAAWLLGACAVTEPSVPVSPGTSVDCVDVTYPEGAVEPMALGEVISPYRWPNASLRADGTLVSLNLRQAPCALDDDIDWSPFDVLLFVSIPAW
ncbi:MAG: hypothetical protein AAGA48_10405 [Myxococcota bacterium]